MSIFPKRPLWITSVKCKYSKLGKYSICFVTVATSFKLVHLWNYTLYNIFDN